MRGYVWPSAFLLNLKFDRLSETLVTMLHSVVAPSFRGVDRAKVYHPTDRDTVQSAEIRLNTIAKPADRWTNADSGREWGGELWRAIVLQRSH